MKFRPVPAAVAALLMALASRAEAMPVFAEAYGYDCTKCHVQVPALNSYGRYVQRTMYAALDRTVLNGGFPIWVGEKPFSDSADPNEPHRIQFGNLEVHAAGFIGKDQTYHIQQWLSQNDRPGGLDTAWVSFNRGPQLHVSVGKMPPPGPSFFSQWADLAPLAVPQITVGEHTLTLTSNRWGAKAGYSGERFVADAGWFGSAADLNGATDLTPSVERTVQAHVAYAPYDGPMQAGLVGNAGTFPLAEGGIDHYSAAAAYVQVDPTHRYPGALFIVQRGWDGNPGPTLGPAASTGYLLSAYYHPLRRWETLFGVRRERTDDGLGTIAQTTDIDFSSRIARYVHGTVEAAAASRGKTVWRYQVWWTTPLRRR